MLSSFLRIGDPELLPGGVGKASIKAEGLALKNSIISSQS